MMDRYAFNSVIMWKSASQAIFLGEIFRGQNIVIQNYMFKSSAAKLIVTKYLSDVVKF